MAHGGPILGITGYIVKREMEKMVRRVAVNQLGDYESSRNSSCGSSGAHVCPNCGMIAAIKAAEAFGWKVLSNNTAESVGKWSRMHAYGLVMQLNSIEVHQALSPIGDIPLPATEAESGRSSPDC